MSRNWQVFLYAVVLFAIFFAAMAWVQFSTPDMPDNDGFYHIKMAQIMRQQGLKPDFIWMPLSVLNEREFYDHHFLFHAALIPFTFGDLRLGAKWACVTFASLALLSIWWLLYSQGVSYAWLWSLGLLAISQAFLFRMNITRAQSLSVALLALALYLMFSGKYRWLVLLGFLYVWLYNAFPLIIAAAGAYTIALWLIERRFDYRPLAYSAAGVALGLIINPYFPYDLVFIYRHYLPKLTETTAVNVGNEWYPYNTRQLLENSTLTWLAFLGGAFALGLRGVKMDTRTATAFLLAGMFGAMLFQSRRFIEYFPPLVLIFAAFAVSPILEQIPIAWRRVAVGAAAVLVAIGSVQMLPQARDSVKDSNTYTLYRDASAWLEANTPQGERVFQTDWDDFPRLFFYNTHNTYLIGLDPTYMQLYDPALYDVWVEITNGGLANLSELIPDIFGTRYIISDLNHGDFIQRAKDDPNIEEVYRDNQAVIFLIH